MYLEECIHDVGLWYGQGKTISLNYIITASKIQFTFGTFSIKANSTGGVNVDVICYYDNKIVYNNTVNFSILINKTSTSQTMENVSRSIIFEENITFDKIYYMVSPYNSTYRGYGDDIKIYGARQYSKLFYNTNNVKVDNIEEYQKCYLETKTQAPKEIPTCSGYEFLGWYADNDCTIEYVYGNTITEDTIVYAKWKRIYSESIKSSVKNKILNHKLIQEHIALENKE